MNDLVIREPDEFDLAIQDLEKTKKICQKLMQTPHYAKLGEVGVFTIIQKAKSMGLNVLDALNGSMYIVNGKVELAANTMNYLIRAKGHSISKDPKSDRNICILNGKRIDNGDMWTSTFSIDDAKKAGIFKNTWEKFPEDMLFSRALTRLARQLFPDVIKGCYVEGEISSSSHITHQNFTEDLKIEHLDVKELISNENIDILMSLLNTDEKYKDQVLKRISELGYSEINEIPSKMYETILNAARDKFREEMIA